MTDDYSALKSLGPAATQLLDILGIVERALLLKAEIPTLEKKKRALLDDIERTIVQARQVASDAAAQSDAISANMERLRQDQAALSAQSAANETDRQRFDLSERERLTEEHKALAAELVSARSRIQAEVRDLERQKATLTKSLKDLVAAVPTG